MDDLTTPVLATALDLGWSPLYPDAWLVDPGEGLWARFGATPFAKAHITMKVREEATRQSWAQAARHDMGNGLETGAPDMGPARRAKAKFIKEGRLMEAKALEAAILGMLGGPPTRDG